MRLNPHGSQLSVIASAVLWCTPFSVSNVFSNSLMLLEHCVTNRSLYSFKWYDNNIKQLCSQPVYTQPQEWVA